MTKTGWEISASGLAIGIILGVIYSALAVGSRIALSYITSLTQSSSYGIAISSALFDFVNSDLFLILVGALIIVKIAHRTIKSPLTVRGPLKVALGALTGIFYYLILAGGVLAFTIGLNTTATGTFEISVTLLVTLGLLELSAAMKILQGVFEYRDGRREARASLSSMETEAPPPPVVRASEIGGSMPTSAGLQATPAAAGAPARVFCRECGRELSPGDAFCGYCGTPTRAG
jgi:hypothetical protein